MREGGNLRLIIVVWGAAILIYLALSRANGTKTVLDSLSNLINSGTKTLQAR